MKEYKQKCRDLEYEKRTAQKQIESLESQKKSLSEKYELVQVNLNVFVQFRSHIYLSLIRVRLYWRESESDIASKWCIENQI